MDLLRISNETSRKNKGEIQQPQEKTKLQAVCPREL